MIDVNGGDYVTWDYRKCIVCPVCYPQNPQCDSSEMKLVGNGSSGESCSSSFKCQNCGLEVIVHHTFSIDCVEVKA